MYFRDGTAYHLQSQNWSPREINDYFANYTMTSRWVEPIRRARNSVNIFIEYACKDIASMVIVQLVYDYMLTNHEESWLFINYIGPRFRQAVPRKTQGWTILSQIITPIVLIALYILHLFIKCAWRCLGCSKKKSVGPVINKQTRREKIE